MFLHRIARRILAEIFVRLPILRKKPVRKGVTVSLTSFPTRLGSLHLVVRSLLKQTVLPERIVLYLGTDSMDSDIPQKLRNLEKLNFIIKTGYDDIKPHKKYFYAMQEYPDDIIITVDDDSLYDRNLVRDLLRCHEKYPEAVCARRVHRITKNADGALKKYNNWEWEYTGSREPSFKLFATGCGGVLYPPHIFTRETFDSESIKKHCLTTDDIWLKFMEVKNNVKVVWSENRTPPPYHCATSKSLACSTRMCKARMTKTSKLWKSLPAYSLQNTFEVQCGKEYKAFIYPANNTENTYIDIQQKAIQSAGLEVTYNLRDFFSTDFFLLNWFETLGGKYEWLDYIKKTIKLIMLVLFRKKILYVIHNKQVHAKYKDTFSQKLSSKLMRKLISCSSKIIILCEETRTVISALCQDDKKYFSKIYKIPHPNYIDTYPVNNELIENAEKGISFLFFGQICKYKNIELLIDVFNDLAENTDVSLTIAGNCKDEEYSETLRSSIKNDNIKCDFRFIPDEDVGACINRHSILVLPYSLESSLNSGTIFLAFSYKRTVISPLIGTLKEFGDADFFYAYDYINYQEHKRNLKDTINQAIKDWQANQTVFFEKGLKAYYRVKEENSFEKITELYKGLFRELG